MTHVHTPHDPGYNRASPRGAPSPARARLDCAARRHGMLRTAPRAARGEPSSCGCRPAAARRHAAEPSRRRCLLQWPPAPLALQVRCSAMSTENNTAQRAAAAPHPVLVDHVCNDDELARLRPKVDEADPPNLHIALERHFPQRPHKTSGTARMLAERGRAGRPLAGALSEPSEGACDGGEEQPAPGRPAIQYGAP